MCKTGTFTNGERISKALQEQSCLTFGGMVKAMNNYGDPKTAESLIEHIHTMIGLHGEFTFYFFVLFPSKKKYDHVLKDYLIIHAYIFFIFSEPLLAFTHVIIYTCQICTNIDNYSILHWYATIRSTFLLNITLLLLI